MVSSYIKSGQVHIDLGCGDAAVLKASPCKEKFGLDSLYSDDIKDKLDFSDNYADYITMVAFIEHLDDPVCLVRECRRILKPGGKLILTTPLKESENFLKLWHKDIKSEHKRYFDKASLEKLLLPFFKIDIYKKYFLNQLIVCTKIEK